MIKNIQQHRPAFSMITAIAVMLIIGLLAGFILSLSASTAQETNTQYQKEQAALLAQAYTEAAILAILKNNLTITNCVQNVDGNITALRQGSASGGSPATGRGYQVSTTVHYIANTASGFTMGTNCPATNILNKSGGALVDYNASYGGSTASLSAIIDVYVRYKDSMYPDMITAPWITYHRRTLQKI